ncbi:unnamed protein product, partial [Phyllotreta striolata]
PICANRRGARPFSSLRDCPLTSSSFSNLTRLSKFEEQKVNSRAPLHLLVEDMRLQTSIVVLVLIALFGFSDARRGRTRSRTKSKFQIGLPITGKYRDPESDQYYNNNNGAKIILASHFDYEYVLGHKIAFLCVARGNPRPHIIWYKDGSEIFTHQYLHIHEWQIGRDKIKSKLEIDPATQMDAGLYECTADNMYSIDRRSFKTDFSIAFD